MNKTLAWNFSQLAPLVTVLLTLVGAYLVVGGYLFHPNRYMFSFGGDALVIYFDMIFHACYDKGTTLGAMNYPHGEYIFLTDAQGAIATVLQWINRYLFDVCDCVPGIVHGFNIYLLPLCSLLVYYLLVYFKVRPYPAVLFAVLITFLSPNLVRVSGHFGLGYPFVIPLAMLWFLRKYNRPYLEKQDVLVLLTLVFFTYNNPYIGFSPAGLLMAGAVLVVLFKRPIFASQNVRFALLVGSVGLLTVLVPYLDFKISDPIDDRIKQQWGFFVYRATWEGLFYPPGSLLYDLLKSLEWKVPDAQDESRINVGLVTVALLVAWLISSIYLLLLGNKSHRARLFPLEAKALFAASFLLFAVAANITLIPFDEKWFEANAGPLLMFKASGRLAWSFYFVLTIGCVVFLDSLARRAKHQWLSAVLTMALAGIWAKEIHNYHYPYFKGRDYPNFFLPSEQQKLKDIITQSGLQLSDYQAMLVVPRLMAWSDNFVSFMHWDSQFYGMRFSALTGLPMVNAMLSRMSTGQTAEAIQMLSHPLIERDLVAKFPNQKDLLLLKGANHPPLKTGEQFLLDIATPVYQSEEFSLYRLSLAAMQRNKHRQHIQSMFLENRPPSEMVFHQDFDGEVAKENFYGQGSKVLPAGANILLDNPLPIAADTQLVFSAWTKIDHEKYDIGQWRIEVRDSTNNTIFDHIIETRASNDIQDMWIRSEATFPAPVGSRLKATFLNSRPLRIDEIMVYPANTFNFIDLLDEPEFMINGYKMDKQPQG